MLFGDAQELRLVSGIHLSLCLFVQGVRQRAMYSTLSPKPSMVHILHAVSTMVGAACLVCAYTFPLTTHSTPGMRLPDTSW